MKKEIFIFCASTLLVAEILVSCVNKTDNKTVPKVDSTITVIDSKTIKDDKITDGQFASNDSIFGLLQGKWQNMDDKTNFIVFEGYHRKEIAEGMDKWDDEIFVLSDICSNASENANKASSEKNRYISCKESDMCWYIVSVDKKMLTLSYVSRGNTLNYKRVK
jgi:hypothetical protein